MTLLQDADDDESAADNTGGIAEGIAEDSRGRKASADSETITTNRCNVVKMSDRTDSTEGGTYGSLAPSLSFASRSLHPTTCTRSTTSGLSPGSGENEFPPFARPTDTRGSLAAFLSTRPILRALAGARTMLCQAQPGSLSSVAVLLFASGGVRLGIK